MNDLEKHVLQIIGEDITTPDVFSDITPVRDSVNYAVQELCMLTGSYKMVYHLPLYAGRNFYRMGWDYDHFGYIIECWDRSRKFKLERTDIYTLKSQDPWFLKLSGNPDRYFEIGNDVVGFDRAPSAHGVVLELTCVAIPRAVDTDAKPVKIRDVFERASVYMGVSEFYASRGDVNRAKDFLLKYAETAGLMELHPDQADRLWQMVNERGTWGASTSRSQE